MSARLVELLRQRAQLQAQLAELNRQIADVSTSETPSAPTPTPEQNYFSPPSVDADPDAILGQYSSSPHHITSDVRKGCLLYAALALALLAASVFALLRFFPH